MVSHDNFFVNRVAEHLFVFEGDGVVRDFQGSYTEYLEYRQHMAQQQAQSKKGQVVSQKGGTAVAEVKQSNAAVELGSAKIPLSQTEKKELNKLEKEMSKVSQKIKDLEDKIGKSSGNEGYSVLADWSKELTALKSELNDKEERWINLVDRQ